MVSFIVIGRNEENTIRRCFLSILETIKTMKLGRFETIYVDSDSDDDSIKITKEFKEIKIFKITGKYNAAIARNIGAKESKGDILFFIDGDMEINPDFLKMVLTEDNKLKFPFVSGQFINYYYDINKNIIKKESYCKEVLFDDKYFPTTGGIFLIKKEIWVSVNGMRIKYRRSQDLDLGLRLSDKGVLLLRKKEVIANHHTIDYKRNDRMWGDLFKGNTFYNRGLLYRDHIWNKYAHKIILTKDPTFLALVVSILFGLFFNFNILYSYGFYFFVILLAILVQKIKNKKVKYSLIPYYFVRDHLTIYAFIFFRPKGNYKYEYDRVL